MLFLLSIVAALVADSQRKTTWPGMERAWREQGLLGSPSPDPSLVPDDIYEHYTSMLDLLEAQATNLSAPTNAEDQLLQALIPTRFFATVTDYMQLPLNHPLAVAEAVVFHALELEDQDEDPAPAMRAAIAISEMLDDDAKNDIDNVLVAMAVRCDSLDLLELGIQAARRRQVTEERTRVPLPVWQAYQTMIMARLSKYPKHAYLKDRVRQEAREGTAEGSMDSLFNWAMYFMALKIINDQAGAMQATTRLLEVKPQWMDHIDDMIQKGIQPQVSPRIRPIFVAPGGPQEEWG